jgi:hypothetical protein
MATMYENVYGNCVNGVELITCDQLKKKSSYLDCAILML